MMADEFSEIGVLFPECLARRARCEMFLVCPGTQFAILEVQNPHMR
jgi:hypothetical protein